MHYLTAYIHKQHLYIHKLALALPDTRQRSVLEQDHTAYITDGGRRWNTNTRLGPPSLHCSGPFSMLGPYFLSPMTIPWEYTEQGGVERTTQGIRITSLYSLSRFVDDLHPVCLTRCRQLCLTAHIHAWSGASHYIIGVALYRCALTIHLLYIHILIQDISHWHCQGVNKKIRKKNL